MHTAKLTHILGAWIPFMPSTRCPIESSKYREPAPIEFGASFLSV